MLRTFSLDAKKKKKENGGRSSRPCTTHVKHLALKLEARSDFDGGPYKVTYVG